MAKRYVSVLLIITIMSGCGHKASTKKQPISSPFVQPRSDEQELLQKIKQQEAKLIDISIPLNATPLPEYFMISENRTQAVTLGYSTSLSVSELLDFYTIEMEHFGWRNIALVESKEYLLFYQKPYHYCAISLRSNPMQTTTTVILSTGLREDRIQ